MIDLKDLRENPDRYRDGARKKRIDADVDAILGLDVRCRELQTEIQLLAAEQNRISRNSSRDIANLFRQEAEAKKAGMAEVAAEYHRQARLLTARPAQLKQDIQAISDELGRVQDERDKLLLRVPQPPDEDVPVGESADDNVERRTWNPAWFDPKKSFAENKGFEPKSHIELGQALGLVDFERGVKMAGSRSYVLTGRGMQLHNAVLQFAFNFMINEHGFQGMSVPVLVREELMVGTGFFPAGREQAYHVEETQRGGGYDLFLTGTGEVGLMGFHQDEILSAEDLPRKYVTVSTCFRREAGAAGKDTAGLYRIHQFDKVEQVVICRADEAESRAWHQKMIGFVEALLQKLELPYRLLQCCTADLGPKNADMVDIETWMPSRDGYGETHSASRLYDFQCRRLNLRYRDTSGATKKTVFCHSLNNTVAASPRILIPILELYQNPDGTITVPTALRPYMGGVEKIG